MTNYNYDLSYASGSCCIFSKELGKDESTLMVSNIAKYDGASTKQTNVAIDGVAVTKGFFGLRKNLTPVEVLEEFQKWAPDAPDKFKRIVGDHLGRNLRVSKRMVDTKLGIKVTTSEIGFEVERKERKQTD